MEGVEIDDVDVECSLAVGTEGEGHRWIARPGVEPHRDVGALGDLRDGDTMRARSPIAGREDVVAYRQRPVVDADSPDAVVAVGEVNRRLPADVYERRRVGLFFLFDPTGFVPERGSRCA
ncbi:hypothetical protein AArcCO_1360 [Halalkaliarchaeum sp. AArc-CO]|uniref:hypothetical protein n=1 Tax=unclassified Halalkaliarchaeum TaxID=2678344 RepID=UPI00217E50D8|nr:MULTISPECIES: hypothetical protein [unclassified Halalkaliarchaeum]MDR5674015.1 hypothetical protein [Halalkaliarchaeum sp. AArc-GB]UWG50668.1 hypothetical protein AArcCO_1360 [Halalkaliarchaeum sp. AArc-CO]